jgi:NhaP-type Na+/H+ or K+/H+ antiporter
VVVKYLSEQMSHGNLQFNMHAPELKQIRDELKRQRKQRFWLAIGATAILAGALLVAFASATTPGWFLMAAGALAAILGRP